MNFEITEDFKFDKQIVEGEDLPSPEVKVSPDYFINLALFSTQKVLVNENIKDGSAKFKMLIEFIEVICRATKLIPSDYDSKIKEYKGTEEFKKISEDYSKHYHLSNFKLGLLMGEIWQGKPLNMRLKL